MHIVHKSIMGNYFDIRERSFNGAFVTQYNWTTTVKALTRAIFTLLKNFDIFGCLNLHIPVYFL